MYSGYCRNREWLYERINERVDQMLAEGLMDEVKQLLSAAEPMSRTARQALGYKELIDFMEGAYSYDRAVELLKQQTRRFAKRQHTFFSQHQRVLRNSCSSGRSARGFAGTDFE